MTATGNWTIRLLPVMAVMAVMGSCNHSNKHEQVIMKPAPVFNADSAYGFVARQVSFGPRVPGTESHLDCGNFLVNTLTRFGAQVVEQNDSVILYNGHKIPLRNIIASFNPDRPDRIMLCAHWDTRPFADQDTAGRDRPFDGANDGASGVGVLLEIARNMAVQSPDAGVDIVLFDAEDQGRPAYEQRPDPSVHFYCLGSRYWAQHRSDRTAQFAILLDMVGAKNAVFTLEGTSMKYAESAMRRIWNTGNQLGYPDYFRYNRTRSLIDDHTYVNEMAGIPCFDIIEHDSRTETTFGTYWHTHQDNLGVIDRNTMKAVGQTVLQAVYNE